MKTIQPNDNPINYIPVGANRIRPKSNSTQKYFPNKNRANAIRPYQIHPFQFARFPFTIKKKKNGFTT
jgi:hypothetical protein